MKTRDQAELVNIGRISTAVGLRGEVRVTGDSDNLKEGKVLLLKRAKIELKKECVAVRYQKNSPIIMLDGINDRTAAEELQGMEIFISAADLDELPEGQHYVRDLIGYVVYDRTSKSNIGILKDVIQNTAQSILDIEGIGGKQIMVPAVDAFMRDIDDDREVIEVELIPGFVD